MKTMRAAIHKGSLVGLILFLSGIGIVWASNLIYADTAADQNLYCQMVHDGTWPDYEKSFAKSCKDWLTENEISVKSNLFR